MLILLIKIHTLFTCNKALYRHRPKQTGKTLKSTINAMHSIITLQTTVVHLAKKAETLCDLIISTSGLILWSCSKITLDRRLPPYKVLWPAQ